MNILLFVISMLMLMTLMTYARIESYRGFALMQSQFEFYMQNLEREDYNRCAKKYYEDHHATEKEQKREKQNQQAQGSSTLSFKIFADKEKREKNQQIYRQFFILAKNLINALYGHTKFLKNALEKDEGIVDRLLGAIGEESAKLSPKEKISNLCDLSRLTFQEEDLKFLFYSMLEGGVEIPKEEQGTLKVQQSYPPLSNYLTMQYKTQIRVFLASRALLTAIFGDRGIVEEVIQKRNELYDEVDKEKIDTSEATILFKNQFEGRRIQGLVSPMLDFSVSKTNPKGYQ